MKIWKFYTDIADCGNIVMNDGQTCAPRVFSYWDGEKAVFSDRMEEEFDIVEGLAHDLQFYSTFDMAAHQPADPSETYWVHNVDSRGPLYLRCDAEIRVSCTTASNSRAPWGWPRATGPSWTAWGTT